MTDQPSPDSGSNIALAPRNVRDNARQRADDAPHETAEAGSPARDETPEQDDDLLAGETASPPRNRTRKALRLAATLGILGVAVVATLLIWDEYVNAPWTRNGRVRVQVASIAPQVSGQITEVRVADNQFVRTGDVLYVIDPFNYRAALAAAKAQERLRAAELQVKKAQSERRQSLSDLAASVESKQVYAGNAEQAQAALEAAHVQVEQAQANLARTEVRSTVNGFITNLLLRTGDYASAGVRNVSIIDSDSYWIDGYFEETKMSQLCIGDRVEARLIGYDKPIAGEIESVTRGISVANATPGTQGLPGVDPVYTWVRLAQRIPVRIRITGMPSELPLVAGMTATVTVRSPAEGGAGRAAQGSAWNRLGEVFTGRTRRPGCLPDAPRGARMGSDRPAAR